MVNKIKGIEKPQSDSLLAAVLQIVFIVLTADITMNFANLIFVMPVPLR